MDGWMDTYLINIASPSINSMAQHVIYLPVG